MGAIANPLGATANPPKIDDKYAQKSVQLVRGSSFRSDFLQNPFHKRLLVGSDSRKNLTRVLLVSRDTRRTLVRFFLVGHVTPGGPL